MTSKEEELDKMLKQEQQNELSSSEDESRDEITSKAQFRKPIKNPFSDHSEESDSDLEVQNQGSTGTPFPPKPPSQVKSVLKQAQEEMKWDKNEQVETEILSKLEGQGMKDKKIKELASKYKTLNLAYEKEKTLRKNLENQINSMIKTPEELNRSSVEKKEKKSLEKTISSNCSSCQENDKKIMDFRLKNQNMKSELNKVMRILNRELGEDFNIDQALGEENSWKGRQQKIEILRNRVKELEEKLNNNGINVSHMSGFTQVTNRTTTNPAFTSTRTSALMAENKKKELDNLKIQVEGLRSENEILQGKVKSLASRKIILENEMKEIKSDFEKKRQLLIEKSDNDDRFIQLLKNENEKLKKEERVVTKVVYKDEGAEVSKLKKEVDNLKTKIKVIESSKDIQPDEKQEKKISKDLNSVRVVSAEKKRKIEEEYLKGDKYLGKMTADDEAEIYRNWKNGVNKN